MISSATKMVRVPDINDAVVYSLAITTARLMQDKQEEFGNIKWTDGEANIDTEYSKLACRCCVEAWDIAKSNPDVKSFGYDTINVQCVIPDINILFTYLLDTREIKKKIELKQSEHLSIPGSTYDKLDINQPVIWTLRPNKKNKIEEYQVICRQYHQLYNMHDEDLFQDRTPRPHLRSPHKLLHEAPPPYETKVKVDMVQHYSSCAVNRVQKGINRSWQDPMVKDIGNKSVEHYLMNTSIEEILKKKTELQMKDSV